MAAVTHAIGTADTGVTPNTSGAFTPAVGDLLVVFAVASATTSAAGVVSSSAGITFTELTSATYAASGNRVYGFVANSLIASAVSQTVTISPAVAGNGSIIFVERVAGMTLTGASAIRQQAKTDNGGNTTVPVATFGAACLTGNVTLGCVGSNTNPPVLTPPTGWTEPATTGDIGYASPTTGGEVVFRDSGFTGTAITWGNQSATVHGVLIVELDASAAAAATSLVFLPGPSMGALLRL